MTSRDFVYWLQGFAEIHGAAPTEKQWEIIRNHLNLVFRHEIDPTIPDPDGSKQDAHDGKPSPEEELKKMLKRKSEELEDALRPYTPRGDGRIMC